MNANQRQTVIGDARPPIINHRPKICDSRSWRGVETFHRQRPRRTATAFGGSLPERAANVASFGGTSGFGVAAAPTAKTRSVAESWREMPVMTAKTAGVDDPPWRL